MAKGIRASIQLEGAQELRSLLQDLSRRQVKTALRAAVTAGSAPIVKAARVMVSRDTGVLKKSLKRKIKTYASGNVAAIIGADRGVTGTNSRGGKQVPANYIHLVEHGHGGPHPAKAYPFLRPAYERNVAAAGRLATTKLKERIEAAAAKNKAKK